MARFKKVHNERSEAIELIKTMDAIAKRNTWQIKSVGGESTLNTGKKRMFPDVFVYGDTARIKVLQGWEVKMPDIPITDADFISDAHRKAEVLGVNSCVIWNFTYAVLYVKAADGWTKLREWDRTSHIKTRSDVTTYKPDWDALISDILSELNSFFISGELRPAKIGDIVANTIFAEIITRNKQLVAEHLKDESTACTVIVSHIKQWWRSVEKEYKFDDADMFSAYARFMLLNWINKITFANLIKGNHNPAKLIETVCEDMTPSGASDVFKEISAKCDFFNIFETLPYGELLPTTTWVDLTDYNSFLCENGIDKIPQEALQSALENSVTQFKRSVSGLYTTPRCLAKILVNAGIDNLTVPCIDPCCGTGTIVREVIIAKESAIGVEKAFATTYASDKNSFPLQITNIAMTRANAINLPSLLFQSNAFNLCEGKAVEIIDPQDGKKKSYRLPKWGSVVSNLPFVAFDREGREEGKHINDINVRVCAESGISLSARADLYQAILLDLQRSLSENASVAIITSNSWLGTLAGRAFFDALNYYFNVESIVVSGNGKWFDNADVITSMLFLKNKSIPQMPDRTRKIYFGLIHKKVSDISDDDAEQIVDSIRLKQTVKPELLSFKHFPLEKIESLLDMNIALNSFFYDVEWLSDIKEVLCPISDLFDVFRGMKTGQDEIYYLRNTTDVDEDYIGRVFKSADIVKH